MRTSWRRKISMAAVAVTSVALAGSGALVAPAGASQASNKSAAWLGDQLDSGLIQSEYNLQDGNGWQQYTDYGLTLDVYYAFGQLDTRPAKRAAILDAIEAEVGNYATFAGGYGKLLTAVEAAGIDPSTYASGGLVGELENLVVSTGAEQGRAKDPGNDYSNTFGQAYVATALAGAGSTRAADATTFLLKQQCAAGYFRESMTSADFTCDGGTGPQRAASVDATATAALAALALATAGPQQTRGAATAAFRDAVSWLVSKQRKDGAFVGNGVANSNSTGLAASVLMAAGKNGRAARAARWIGDLQVTRKLVRSTGFRPRDLGAVAYNRAAFNTGRTEGVSRAARYEWRRATAQAAPALDLIG